MVFAFNLFLTGYLSSCPRVMPTSLKGAMPQVPSGVGKDLGQRQRDLHARQVHAEVTRGQAVELAVAAPAAVRVAVVVQGAVAQIHHPVAEDPGPGILRRLGAQIERQAGVRDLDDQR